jgi:hypothetical protein
MKLSTLVAAVDQENTNAQEVVEDAVNRAKINISEVYLNKSLRRLSNESPFVALGIPQATWEQFPPEWRKKARALWRKHVQSRKELLGLADKISSELDEFTTKLG